MYYNYGIHVAHTTQIWLQHRIYSILRVETVAILLEENMAKKRPNVIARHQRKRDFGRRMRNKKLLVIVFKAMTTA